MRKNDETNNVVLRCRRGLHIEHRVKMYAHHSFAATYFEDKTVTIEGNLKQFLYRNPHSFRPRGSAG